jgi:hypothetical protein
MAPTVGEKTLLNKKSVHHYGANCRRKNIAEQITGPSYGANCWRKNIAEQIIGPSLWRQLSRKLFFISLFCHTFPPFCHGHVVFSSIERDQLVEDNPLLRTLPPFFL